MMKSTGAAAAFFAATLSAGFACTALAQNAVQPRSNGASAPQPAAASQAADERPAVRAPVLKVLSVEVIRSTHVEAVGARNGVGVVKLMGRHSGFIACHATIASLSGGSSKASAVIASARR